MWHSYKYIHLSANRVYVFDSDQTITHDLPRYINLSSPTLESMVVRHIDGTNLVLSLSYHQTKEVTIVTTQPYLPKQGGVS